METRNKNQNPMTNQISKDGKPDPGDRTQGTIVNIANTPSYGGPNHLTGVIYVSTTDSNYQFLDACFYQTFGDLSAEEIVGMTVWFTGREFKVAGTCEGGAAAIWIATELSFKA